MENKPKKIHYCFNCGAETDNREDLPNGREISVCHDPECQKEHKYQYQSMEADMRDAAREDNYSRY